MEKANVPALFFLISSSLIYIFQAMKGKKTGKNFANT